MRLARKMVSIRVRWGINPGFSRNPPTRLSASIRDKCSSRSSTSTHDVSGPITSATMPNHPLTDPPEATDRHNRLSFSLGSVLVVTIVVAFAGLLLGQMVQALRSQSAMSMGYFAMLAAIAPSVALVGAGSMFKMLRWMRAMMASEDAPLDSDDPLR